jgi:hypothetical protein
VQLLATLKKLGWQGVAECIGQPARTEATPDDRELLKRQFITNSITALTIAIQQSEQLAKDWEKGLSPSEVGIMAALVSSNLNPDDILMKAVSSDSTDEEEPPEEVPPPPPPKAPTVRPPGPTQPPLPPAVETPPETLAVEPPPETPPPAEQPEEPPTDGPKPKKKGAYKRRPRFKNNRRK